MNQFEYKVEHEVYCGSCTERDRNMLYIAWQIRHMSSSMSFVWFFHMAPTHNRKTTEER